MSLILMLLAGAPDPMMEYRRLTMVDAPCVSDRNTTDITVCGRRRADRFRVPFKIADPADPANETALAERERMIARTSPVKALSPFLVGGGMAGVSASAGANGVRVETPRPLAP